MPGGAGMRAAANGEASRKAQGLNGFRGYSPPAASGTGLDLHSGSDGRAASVRPVPDGGKEVKRTLLPLAALALGILAEQFEDRPVVGIHAVELVWGLGTLHCLTQQQPAVEIAKAPSA